MNDIDGHDSRPLRPLSGRRLALTITGALGLLAVVVLASRGDPPSGGGGDGQTASAVLVNVVLLVLAVVVAAMVVVVLLGFSPGKSPAPKPRTGPRLAGQMILFVLIVGAVLGAVALLRETRDGGETGDRARDARTSPLSELARQRDRNEQPPVDWLPILLVFGCAVVAFTTAGVVMLRRRPLPPTGPSLAEQLSQVLDETLDDLYAERDPRRAVIAAYARMERTLAAHGLARRAAEAPHEYVARVLEEVTASAAAVRRLTRLFERAKFSAHAVGPDMKAEAIGALEEIRDEIRAHETEPLVKVPH